MRVNQDPTSQSRIVRAVERRLNERFQKFVFWRAMRRFQRVVTEGREIDAPLLAELVRGWGNRWSAQTEFLAACLREARTTAGPILECGSGLSTVLVGAVAQSRGIHLWTLEHELRWADHVAHYLRKYQIHAVNLCLAPIRSYGDFDWYSQPSLQTLPGQMSLVICDGPPGDTRGGRYGLVPVMLEKLRPDCTVLLDDGARGEEQSIAERWGRVLAAHPEILGSEKPFIRLRAGTSHPA